ncbi:hypothetical protein EYF80_030668 [Liparis tanakae]|uniref:Uncharacterized protein n=1 Tax=Liparis tanakae TaxID=230148 RepID=A0A4Z2H2U3_9TELE|nr:hypothetical protein EYF80_030668 [Liparis tanakae]
MKNGFDDGTRGGGGRGHRTHSQTSGGVPETLSTSRPITGASECRESGKPPRDGNSPRSDRHLGEDRREREEPRASPEAEGRSSPYLLS